MRPVQVVNHSKTVTASMLSQGIAAVQTQLDRDFAPQWGVTLALQVVDKYDPSARQSWSWMMQPRQTLWAITRWWPSP